MKTQLLMMVIAVIVMSVVGVVVFGLAMLTFNFDRELDDDITTEIQEFVFSSDVEKLLILKQIDYTDKLVVVSGPAFSGDPGCGAVIDTDDVTHWFEIDSISNPQTMTLLPENPHPCEVNTTSCFCNAQIELTSLTHDLDYFTPQEEEKYANILLDYIKNNAGMKNIEPKFKIGKLNLNFTDPDAIGYCGELPSGYRINFFSGAIVDGYVKDYGLDSELPSLCALHDDAKWWEKK